MLTSCFGELRLIVCRRSTTRLFNFFVSMRLISLMMMQSCAKVVLGSYSPRFMSMNCLYLCMLILINNTDIVVSDA